MKSARAICCFSPDKFAAIVLLALTVLISLCLVPRQVPAEGEPLSLLIPQQERVSSIDVSGAFEGQIWLTVNGSRIPLELDIYRKDIKPLLGFERLLEHSIDLPSTDASLPWRFISVSSSFIVLGNRDMLAAYNRDSLSLIRLGKGMIVHKAALTDIAYAYADTDILAAISTGVSRGTSSPDMASLRFLRDKANGFSGVHDCPPVTFPAHGQLLNLAVCHDEERKVCFVACLRIRESTEAAGDSLYTALVLLEIDDGMSAARQIQELDVPEMLDAPGNALSHVSMTMIRSRPVLLLGGTLVVFAEQPTVKQLPPPPCKAEAWSYSLDAMAECVYLIYAPREQPQTLICLTYELDWSTEDS